MRYFLLAMTIGLLTSGCSTSPSPNYGQHQWGTVTGVVTLDGAPLADAQVTFFEKGKSSSYGKTDSDGRYELIFDKKQKGAMVGPKLVSIVTQYFSEEGGGTIDESGKGSAPKEKLSKQYNTETQLKADVQSGSNTFDFALSSKPATT